MLTKKEYLGDPCRAASIPYWKAVRIAVPENMKILHEDNKENVIDFLLLSGVKIAPL